MGLIMIFLVPPFQKPDEPSHFIKLSMIDSGTFVCEQSRLSKITSYSQSVGDLLVKLNPWSLVVNPSILFDYNKIVEATSIKSSNNKIEDSAGNCTLNPVGYIPNLIGYKISKIFNAEIISFYFARIFGFLTFLLAILFAYRKANTLVAKNILLVYGAIPVVLHEVTKISYDVTLLSITPIVFVYFTNLWNSIIFDYRKFLYLNIAIFILCVTKPVYIPMVLLPLILFLKHKLSHTKYDLAKYILSYTTVIIAAFIAAVVISKYSIGNIAPEFVNSSEQIKGMVHHPLHFMSIVLKDFYNQGFYYYQSMLIGLGWLEYKLNVLLLIGFTIIAAKLIITPVQEKLELLKQRQLLYSIILLTVIIASCYILIVSTLYVYATPVNLNRIGGVQGRYFIPLLPFLLLVINQISQIINKNLFYFFVAFILIIIPLIDISNRYIIHFL